MEKINAGEELFDEIELIGRTGLFTELRVDKRAIPDRFRGGKELAEFLEPTFPITETEGDKLLGYMDGHGFLLGHKDGELYRGDLCYAQGETLWEPYSIDDAVNAAFEWNDNLLQEAKAELSDSKDMIDFANKKSYLDLLCEDEKILDAMFDRTRYGKELDALAVTLVEALIQDMKREGDIDAAIEKMAAQIRAGEDSLSDVSTALKQNTGRSR